MNIKKALMLMAVLILLVVSYLVNEPRSVYIAGFSLIFIILFWSKKFREWTKKWGQSLKGNLIVGIGWFILFAWLMDVPDSFYPTPYYDTGGGWSNYINHLNLDFHARCASSVFCAIGAGISAMYNGFWAERLLRNGGSISIGDLPLSVVMFFIALGITCIPNMAN